MPAKPTHRPLAVWAISIVASAMAGLQIAILSGILLTQDPAAIRIASMLEPIDYLTFFGASALLLISMALFFRLRKKAVSWFGAYIGLGSLACLGYSLSPRTLPYFDELVSLAGLLVALAVFAYMLRLRGQQRLV
jgi:hypothetical protein